MIRYRILTELTFRKDLSHPEVAGGEPDDGGLVQLTRDGRGQREQLPELEEFGVFLLSPISRGVLALVLLGHRETEIAIEVKAREAKSEVHLEEPPSRIMCTQVLRYNTGSAIRAFFSSLSKKVPSKCTHYS